jgi:hypothetical protein
MAAQGATKRSFSRKPATGPSGSLRAPSANWMQHLQELAAFKNKFGHCFVSTLDKKYSTLGLWVRTQRGLRRRGELSTEKIRQLDEMGFVWEVSQKTLPYIAELKRRAQLQWDSMYKALAAYRQIHGYCPALHYEKARTCLEKWVAQQRYYRSIGKLTKDKIQLLDALSFVWNLEEARWEKRFAALVAFKKTHGHCEVPGSWAENRQLATWTTKQRCLYKQGRLLPERRKRLEAMGFRCSKSSR